MHTHDKSKFETTKKSKSNSSEEVFFPKKNWLPRVGFEPTTLCPLDRVLCQLSHRGSSVDMYRYIILYVQWLLCTSGGRDLCVVHILCSMEVASVPFPVCNVWIKILVSLH